MDKINLAQKLAMITRHYVPHIVGELNGQYVKLVKFKGPFDWHFHEKEDELFLVVKGQFRMELRDKTIDIGEGEFIVIPHGAEHRPVADDEVHVLLFEPVSTLNTGNVRTDKTVDNLEKI